MNIEEQRKAAIQKADELVNLAVSTTKTVVGSQHDHLVYVVLALMGRILEFQKAARNLLDHSPEAPVAIITLARAQYESYLTLKYILTRPTPSERKKLAVDLLKFEAYEQIVAIGADMTALRAKSSDTGKRNLDRRIQIHDEVKANLSRAQRGQGKYPTWNGLTIKQTADAVGEKNHDKWYDVMSKVAHCKPSMFHKSITMVKEGYVLGNIEKGECDAIEWLERMNRILEGAINLVATMQPA